MRLHLENSVQVWAPSTRQMDILDILEKVQWRATKMVKGLEHLFYDRRLRERELLSLEKD